MASAFGKFVSGKRYYSWNGQEGPPEITTWIFLGHIESDCSSTSCDRDYFFYEFAVCSVHFDSAKRVKVPDLIQAESTFLSWDELRTRIAACKGQEAKGE
jgi:hypothetical protein